MSNLFNYMRFSLILLFILLLSGSCWQRAAAQTPVLGAVTTAPPVRSDTVAAVQRLFSARRTGGIIWSVIGAAFTGRILGASIGDGFNNAGSTVVGIAVFGGIPGGIGIGKLSRFSRATEEAVVTNYQQRHQLPPYVLKRLKRKFF
jgi:uncharacterized protein YcfJ